jgi:lysophospholipase L1-like esterase
MSKQRDREKRLKLIRCGAMIALALATSFVLVTALFPQRTAAPAPADIETKAAEYSKEVRARMAAERAAFEESRRVHTAFPTDRALRILYVGDSLSDGHSATRVANGYRPTLTAELSKRGPVEEYRSEVLTTELKMAGNVVSVSGNMDVVIVQLGTNDAGGGGRTPITQFTVDYEALLSNIRTTSPTAAMLCLGTWRAPGTAEPYDKVIDETCGRHGGKYVDLTELYADQRNRGPAGKPAESGGISDNAHPNDTGYKAIKDVLRDRIAVT